MKVTLITLLVLVIWTPKISAQENPVFADHVLPRVDIFIEPNDLDWLLAEENVGNNDLRTAWMIYDNGESTDTIENIGLRLRGNTSRSAGKKSFKISFNDPEIGREKYGLDKLNLNGEHNDPSIIRSKLAWDILAQIGSVGSRANHVELYINGDFFGVYINVEHIDEEYTKSRFGNNDGNLYKCTFPATLDYKGTNQATYKEEQFGKRPYELKNNLEEDDYSDLVEFIDILNNTPTQDFGCAIERVFNVDSYLKQLAVEILISHWDGPVFNANNFYLYHNTQTDLFEFIPFDLDNTFGIDWFIGDLANREIYSWKSDNFRAPIYRSILSNTAYRQRFNYYMKQILDEVFNPDILFPYLDEKKALIQDAVLLDSLRSIDYGFSFQDFEDSYEKDIGQHVVYGLKEYIEQRHDSALDQLNLVDIEPIIRPKQPRLSANNSLVWNAEFEDDKILTNTQLCYSLGDNPSFTCIPMIDDGNHEDGDANDGLFGAVLNAPNDSQTIFYYFAATDDIGLESRYPICEEAQYQWLVDNDLSLHINEFMAKNDNSITDEVGEFDDWIEIYNSGTEAISMSNIFLTDDLTNPDKWNFPDRLILPSEFLIVWADEDQEQGDLHSNFKLSAEGEEVAMFALTENGFELIEAIDFGEQEADISFGRIPNGTGDFKNLEPTPGASNEEALSSYDFNSTDEIGVFPNPAKDHFFIDLSEIELKIDRIELFEVSGKLVRTIDLNNKPNKLQISILDLPNGLYILKLFSANHLRFEKNILIKM